MSWYQLDSVLKERAAYVNFYKTRPLVACPNDGEPLRIVPGSEPGLLYCPFDGFQYPRDYVESEHQGM